MSVIRTISRPLVGGIESNPEVATAYSHWIADTEAERPASGTQVGDLCYCKDTKKLYKCTSISPSVVWEDAAGGGGGSRLPQAVSFGGYVVLTNVGTGYDGIAQSKGLGMAVVDFTGVVSVDFRVFVNKVGTGTQSWQLYNVTDGAQIGVIDDAGAAGDKTLSVTITSGLPSGVKLVRVRAKSTTAADDPVYYGGTIALS